MASITAVMRPTLGFARLSSTRCFSTCSPLAKKEKGAFLTDEALAVREARKKKREEAASRKIDPVFFMTVKDRRELRRKEKDEALKKELESLPPLYQYSEEFIKSYTPTRPGISRGLLRKKDLALWQKKKADREMERAHRRRYLDVPLSLIHSNYVMEPDGMDDLARCAVHFNLAKDVFRKEGLLLPTPLKVRHPDRFYVHRGNVLVPAEAQKQPTVSYKPASDETLYTLLMTTPDGNIYSYRQEVLHWMTVNIPGNKVDSGEEICPYMPPIPCEGTGYHRYAFVLLKQEAPIEGMAPLPSRNLERRTWSTADFIAQYQLGIRGLAFYQAKWDETVGEVFNELGCGEPVYKLEEPIDIHLNPVQREAVHKRHAYTRHERKV